MDIRPNIRLPGANNPPIDSIGEFLSVSAARSAATVAAAVAAANTKGTITNTSARVVASVGSGSGSSGNDGGTSNHNSGVTSTWGTSTKTLADFVKESPWTSSNITTNHSTTTSMPWAAAVKSPPEHSSSASISSSSATTAAAVAAAANSFDYNNTIGSWSSPDTSSSGRGGWNADGSSRNDGALDDGTAIWGNPSSKKTGVDWTEKESSLNPPQSQVNNNLEKRIHKPEPTISSLNGTEAWGAPVRSSPLNSQQQQPQQQSSKNDNSGNTYGTKSAGETSSLSWGESSSLQTKTNENSSPPNNSVWNNLGINNKQQSPSDWLSLSSGIVGGGNNAANVASSRLEELSKQLESTNLFDSITSKSSSVGNNPNLEHHPIGTGILGGSNGGGSLGGGNAMNDLKQMSANYSNDLLDSPNRQQGNSAASNNQQQSQRLENTVYSSAAAPSRDLLKQMVHQIQLAVQAGHLNAHILNQPMSTPTLQLVYHLLQQIKALHQLQEIQHRAGIKSDVSSTSNFDIQINRIRQNISLLQKAITQQQAALTKNDTLSDSSINKQQQANNYSYATISKLSTSLKVPSNNMSNIISNSNIDSFRGSGLIDTLNNSNSDSLRSAQATYDANTINDKTLSSSILASSSNNILGSNKPTLANSGDFSKAQQGFTSGTSVNNNPQQAKGLMSAAQSSSSSSAWSAFSSNDFVSQQGWPSQLRISSNVSQDQQHHQQQQQQQHQFSAFDMMPDFGPGKAWRGSSVLADSKDNSTMAPGANVNIARPNSASNSLKQMNENDILSRDPSFYDWSNNSDSSKRNFNQISAASSFSPSAIGGLSMQSNPWMFAPNPSSLNVASSLDNSTKNINSGSNSSIGGGGLSIGSKLDNGNSDKMAGDSLFLKPNNTGNIQRSSSAMYDWGDLTSSKLHFSADTNHLGKQQSSSNSGNNVGGSGGGGSGARPAPPPGLLSNFGPLIGGSSSANGISLLDSKMAGSSQENSAQLQSRESSSSLWSGNWFD